MNDLTFEVVDDSAQFFAPVSSDAIDGLIGQYDKQRALIGEVDAFFSKTLHGGVIHYFLDGNFDDQRGHTSLRRGAEQLFDPVGAIGALNAAYWSKALHLTDVLDLMPQKRRDEWHEQIRHPLGKPKHRSDKQQDWEVAPLPDFTDENVRSTLIELLNMRSKFLAERVDGIFRGLSGEHVTNAPEAFGKRMIIAHVLGSYGSSEHRTCGLINDLRCVIAKFMGRDEPGYQVSSHLINTLKGRWGEWVTVDGGALRIRLYKKGTAHLEVHPDMAWRLNCVLAQLHPLAIPAEFRQKPKKRVKEFSLMQRPLPFKVLALLESIKPAKEKLPQQWPERWVDVPNTVTLGYGSGSEKAELAEVARILESIGGTRHPTRPSWFEFDYRPFSVINEIITTGCVPDTVSHQFYPTPDWLADKVVELADVAGRTTLEPSAGNGSIADKAAAAGGIVTCVEVSKLRSAVLEAKGHAVVTGDFLAAALPEFDRVAMNPPFDQGRWQAHLTAAGERVKAGGKLVAILPSGAKAKDVLPGWECKWHGPFDNAFPGASVSVVVLEAVKPA